MPEPVSGNGVTPNKEAPAWTDRQLEMIAAITANIASSRKDWQRLLTDPRRNIEAECGYPEGFVDCHFYQSLFDRFSIAARVVKLLPRETWQVQPNVYEDEDAETETEFEAAWNELGQSLRGEQCWYSGEKGSAIWEYLQRADEQSGIGQYGILLMGFDDGQPLDQPLVARSSGNKKGGGEVLNSRGASDKASKFNRLATIERPSTPTLHTTEWVAGEDGTKQPHVTYHTLTDNGDGPTLNGVRLSLDSSGRASVASGGFTLDESGEPMEKEAQYGNRWAATDQSRDVPRPKPANKAKTGGGPQLTFLRVFPESLAPVIQFETNPASPRYGQPIMYLVTMNDPRAQSSGVGLSTSTFSVHWTRVIHIADILESSEVFAQPRMRPHIDHLLALKKLYGASAEGYWRSCFMAWSWETQDGDVDINVTQMRDVIEKIRNSLQRDFITQGMTAKPMAPQVVDPGSQINVHLQAIAIEIGCPMRVLMGSERGELASSQDDGKWNDVVRGRQNGYVTPRIIRPFVSRLICIGTLPEPEEYKVWWPDVESAGAAQKAQVLLTRTQAYAAYVSGNIESVIPPAEYMTTFDNMTQDEAENILESAQEHVQQQQADEIQHQQDQIDAGVAPDPTQPSPDTALKVATQPPGPVPSVNSNPDGCNQYTGKGCSGLDIEDKGVPEGADADYHAEGVRKIRAAAQYVMENVPHKFLQDAGVLKDGKLQIRAASMHDPDLQKRGLIGLTGGFADDDKVTMLANKDDQNTVTHTLVHEIAHKWEKAHGIGDGEEYMWANISDVSKMSDDARSKWRYAAESGSVEPLVESIAQALHPHTHSFGRRSEHLVTDFPKSHALAHKVLKEKGITINTSTFSQEDPTDNASGSMPDDGGRWITTEDGRHLYLRDGELYLHPKGKKLTTKGGGDGGDNGERGGRDGGGSKGDGAGVEGSAGRSGHEGASGGGHAGGQSLGKLSDGRLAASTEEVNKRLDRYEKLFREKGNHQLADWMGQLRNHVNTVGGEELLKSLGEAKATGSLDKSKEKVQYGGIDTEDSPNWKSSSHFISSYLNRAGIIPLVGQDPDAGKRIIHSQTNDDPFTGKRSKKPIDFQPVGPAYDDKLQESKDLPGLGRSEDISKVMGKPVTHLTPEVLDKMNSMFGTDKWLIKTYGDYAFAGQGIFFPQRVRQITQDAKNTIWSAGEHLDKYGFKLARDGNTGEVKGIIHESGDLYRFGSKKYNETISGDARHWAEAARAAAENERGAKLPFGGKDFMVQPAFAAVGVTEEDRKAGKTIAPGEGRVHLVVRNGKAEVIPHATWIKGESLPVVFETDDTRAMAKAAKDAIDKLPEKARSGQIYAPDVLKTPDGYKVVELNASVEYGGSGYLSDNPLVIDSFVSHLTNRDPAHVQFIRKLLSSRKKRTDNRRWSRLIVNYDEHIPVLNYDPEQPRDAQGRFGHGAMATLKKIGARVGHAEHVAKRFAEDKIHDAVTRLPKPAQRAVKAAYAVGKVATKAAFSTWIAGQHMAERVAQAKGATQEQARRLRGILSGIDIAAMKPIQIGLGAGGLAAAALPASMIPPATAAYLAYSTARHPIATLRAAAGLVHDAAKGALGKLTAHRPKGAYAAFMTHNGELVLNDSQDTAEYLEEVLRVHDYSDWYIALLSAAIEETGSLPGAIDLANKVYNHHPEDTSSPEDDDALKVLGTDAMVDNSFDESKHPRDTSGKFTESHGDAAVQLIYKGGYGGLKSTKISKEIGLPKKDTEQLLEHLVSQGRLKYGQDGKYEYVVGGSKSTTSAPSTPQKASAPAVTKSPTPSGNDFKDLFNKLGSVDKVIQHIRQNTPAETMHHVTMSKPEKMHTVNIHGITVKFGESINPYNVSYLNGTLSQLPDGLKAATKQVIMTSQANKHDEQWAKQYGMPDFKSRATADGSTMTLYGGGTVSAETFAHESGHNLAYKAFGGFTPTPSSEYGKAQKVEKPVSTYGATSPQEDFADAVKMYVTEHGKLKSNFPKKYEALTNLMKSTTTNAFCATGDGGGVDPSCSPGGKSTKAAKQSDREKYTSAKVGKDEHEHAANVEKEVAAAIKGEWEPDNKEYDARIPGKHAVEVKTLMKRAENVISVHDDALLRKVDYVAGEGKGEKFHTVVADDRDVFDGGKFSNLHKGHRLYYKRGSGRYNIANMHKIDSMDELPKLMNMKDSQLPEKARGSLPADPKEIARLRAAFPGTKEARYLKDRARKSRIKAEEAEAAAKGKDATPEMRKLARQLRAKADQHEREKEAAKKKRAAK